ncbi:hypothetical protein FH972_023800 [Carpinus fangiana]|uniref:Poly [ADP-ribose] polymerase n=1 Tax=Carpinus fangiana TaxID=176857 RepID=A0A5N6KWM4_9ROSI|nr:hypothetical protein FH972_023800 [Carpinus fangiana]
MPPKRKATKAPVAKAAPPQKQPKQDGQKAVSRDLNVPIDEGFPGVNAAAPAVYIDPEGIIFDVSLNQSNVSNNNNKFYNLQLIGGSKKSKQFWTWTRWGRVGDFGQTKLLGPDPLETAMKDFEKKFKDKTGHKWEDRDAEPKKGKYTFIQKSYEDDDDDNGDAAAVKKEEDDDGEDKKPDVASKLPIATQRLIELIFNENHFNSVLENIGYNNDKLPLGKLGKSTIKKGFEHLKELASLIKHPSLAQNKYQQTQEEAIEEFTNKYYSTIPHIFGRNRPPLINNNDILQRETAMLDTLSDMEIANQIMKVTSDKAKDADSVSLIDKRFAQLNCDNLSPLDHKSAEYHALKDYLINTAGHTHSIRYRLQDIFRVERAGEDARFRKSAFNGRADTCRRLLWHGSRTTNFGGILSQGLRIAPPEAPVNGYMFGKGVYLADISTKSANYCMSSSSGGHGLLLLCEAELGRPMHELLSSDYNADEECKKKGKIATLGIGRTCPQGWVDAGDVISPQLKGVQMPDPKLEPGDQKQHPTAYLQYNEYICYDVAQIKIKYLLRFAM